MTHAFILTSRNPDWGFYGEVSRLAAPDEGWSIAFREISERTGVADYGIRDFLDSRHGRHFADDVANGLAAGDELSAAISTALDRWMNWKTDRAMSRTYGIPCGLPYLAGLVQHYEIIAEV